MFARLAAKLRENRWTSLIPVRGKIPLIAGWSQFNHEPPVNALIERWSRHFPNAGIGLAFGPDKVIGVDLDWTEAAPARRALELTSEICGPTDFFRIGRAPKTMLFYRASSGLIVHGRSFGGFEIFSTTGQAVLFSVHPDTGQPYHWPKRSPEDGKPTDLPELEQSALDALLRALEPFCHKGAPRNPRTLISERTNGRVTLWLKTFRNNPDQDPLELCRAGISGATSGDRYPTAFGAVVALVMIGRADAEIYASVISPYSTLFDRHEARRRVAAMRSALKWAREHIGPDDATIEQNTGAAHIADHWNRRWRRA